MHPPDDDLQAALAAEREQAHVWRLLDGARARARALQLRVRQLEGIAAREQREADRLAGGPLALFHRLLGSLEDRRDRERQEAVAAALKLDEARAELALLDAEVTALDQRSAALEDAPERLAAAAARKEEWLRQHDPGAARALAHLCDEEAQARAQLREVAEARAAARVVAQLVAGIEASLAAASGWGTADLFGGGVIMAAIKFAKMDEVRRQIPLLETALRRLAAECADLGAPVRPPPLQVGQQGWIADVVFDNLITDWSFLGSLGTTRESIAAVRRLAEEAERQIGRREGELVSVAEQARARRRALVHGP